MSPFSSYYVRTRRSCGTVTAKRPSRRSNRVSQTPPVLMPPVAGRPIFLYMTVLDESMGCVLGQHDDSGKKEQAIYYLSKKFTACEMNYSMLERTCCALVWASHRLRQYMLSHTTWLISKMDPVKYIFEKPALTGESPGGRYYCLNSISFTSPKRR